MPDFIEYNFCYHVSNIYALRDLACYGISWLSKLSLV